MDNRTLIQSIIIDFAAMSPHNDMRLQEKEKIFDTPLVGFSSGADPLYSEFKAHIGNFYFTPLELFAESFPDMMVSAEELTVISWILPSTPLTRKEQSDRERHPSERWARTRDLGEKFNIALREHVTEKLVSDGIAAVAPLLAPHWARSDDGPYAPCSNWSERHAAFAAGLGTFGLCDGLITPVGKAVRIGSVIAAVNIPANKKPYDNRNAYCLHFTENTCRKCIPRCPVKALNEEGHDKKRCMKYTEQTMNKYIKKEFGLDTYACGLCQCNVPCMDKIPTPEDVS